VRGSPSSFSRWRKSHRPVHGAGDAPVQCPAEFLLQFLVDHGFVWSSMVTAEFLIALKMLLAPAVLMGLAFTAAAKSIPDTLGSPSMAVARLYVFNTVGCVAGSIIAGFVLLPLIGLEKSILTLAAVAVVIGIVLCAEPGLPLDGRY